MTTFHPKILQCPKCKALMYTFDLMSYTIHKSVVYSDGKIEHSNSLSSDKQILICSDCRNPMWKSDVFLDDPDIRYDELPEAKDVFDLPFAFDADFSNKLALYYSDLLQVGFADTSEKEIYLRIKIWQLLNNEYRNQNNNWISDIIRGSTNTQLSNFNVLDSFQTLFIANLETLTKIYKPNCDEQQLLLAEMYREMGSFEEADNKLKEIINTNNNSAYKQILRFNNNKKSNVFKIS